jgi:hypothetical protein
MIDLPKGLWRWLSENARDLKRIAAAAETIALEVAEMRRTMQEDEEMKDR